MRKEDNNVPMDEITINGNRWFTPGSVGAVLQGFDADHLQLAEDRVA